MRFFLLAIAALSSSPACVMGQSRAPIVVLVHGRGHLEDDTASLRRSWKASLDTALRQVQMPTLADDDVRLAWYADVLDPSEDHGCVLSSAASDTGGFETFARDFLGSLASALPKQESREIRTLLGDMLYAVDPSRRCATQRRVGTVIDAALSEDRPVIVVAYSLGAMITYAELDRRGVSASRPAIRLITIGSPLGNAEIREILGEPAGNLRLPRAVASWENVYDPHDAFSAPLGGEITGVVDRELPDQAATDPHHVSRYLQHRVTGQAIARAICASTPRKPEQCSGL